MTKRFLVSVADVTAYDLSTSEILFVGKTLLDSSVETSLNATDVRGGRGNQLQYVYYNTTEFTATINDTQFNLAMLAANTGNAIVTDNDVYFKETITLDGSGDGTVTNTPLAVTGTTVYGWVSYPDGTSEKKTFSTKTISCGAGHASETVCVTYYMQNVASRSVTLEANTVPSICRVVMEAQLAETSDTSSNIVGSVQIIIPQAQVSGAFSLSMTADGVASTPLTVRALSYVDTTTGACTNDAYLAKIIEIVDGADWWDNIRAIAIAGGDFTIAHPGTEQLTVYAIPTEGAAFIPPVADLTFASGTVGTATIDANGLVTSVAAGTTLISVTVTSATSYDSKVTCTVTS